MTLDELQAKRAALVEARTNEVRSTRFGEDSIEFKSDRELATAIAALDREIAAMTGRRTRTFLPHFSKGL